MGAARGSEGPPASEYDAFFTGRLGRDHMLVGAAEAPDAESKVLNLGAEAPEVTIGSLAELIVDVVGKPLSIQPSPPHPGSPARRAPAMRLMRDLVGIDARVSLADGVRTTWDWYRRHVFAA